MALPVEQELASTKGLLVSCRSKTETHFHPAASARAHFATVMLGKLTVILSSILQTRSWKCALFRKWTWQGRTWTLNIS